MIPFNQTITFQNLWLGFNFSFIDMIFMVGNKHLLIGKNIDCWAFPPSMWPQRKFVKTKKLIE
jgi:hypothetical protein